MEEGSKEEETDVEDAKRIRVIAVASDLLS
jgi:hypothetical protein